MNHKVINLGTYKPFTIVVSRNEVYSEGDVVDALRSALKKTFGSDVFIKRIYPFRENHQKIKGEMR